MNRITRLLATPPSRGRWGAYAALGVVMTAGALFTVQVVAAGNWRPELQVTSTTDGKLGPGDTREISAHGVDGDRYYRASVDGKGKLTELYKRNGKVQPIDPDARRWIDGVQSMSLAPPPPPPPAPPPPPPVPPAPPAPPRAIDSPDFQALFAVVAAHPTVTARLGTPVAIEGTALSGNMHLEGRKGDADMRFKLRGPKGHAQVEVEATRLDGRWKVDSLDLD